jgi:nitrate reductase cytochrome c-type subunit
MSSIEAAAMRQEYSEDKVQTKLEFLSLHPLFPHRIENADIVWTRPMNVNQWVKCNVLDVNYVLGMVKVFSLHFNIFEVPYHRIFFCLPTQKDIKRRAVEVNIPELFLVQDLNKFLKF